MKQLPNRPQNKRKTARPCKKTKPPRAVARQRVRISELRWKGKPAWRRRFRIFLPPGINALFVFLVLWGAIVVCSEGRCGGKVLTTGVVRHACRHRVTARGVFGLGGLFHTLRSGWHPALRRGRRGGFCFGGRFCVCLRAVAGGEVESCEGEVVAARDWHGACLPGSAFWK